MQRIYGSMEFSQKLRLHMSEQRLSQDDIARALDVSQGMVSGWCRGRYKPDIYQGQALARLLRLSLDYLVDEEIPALEPNLLDLDREIRRLEAALGVEESWRRLAKISDPGGDDPSSPMQGIDEAGLVARRKKGAR